jgi:hypothetical protein
VGAVAAVSAPIMPGDRGMPEWWTAEDEVILRGELAKLAELPPPMYVERRMHEMVYMPITDQRQPRSFLAFGAAMVLACLLVIALLIALVPSPARRAPCTGCATSAPASGTR